MSQTDTSLLEYRQTGDATRSELTLRVMVTFLVAVILTAYAPASQHFWYGWCAMVSSLFVFEVVLYRYFLGQAPKVVSTNWKVRFASLSVLISLLYLLPVPLLMALDGREVYFAVVALLGGTLINLTVHNGQSHLIYFSAACPHIAGLLAVGAYLSFDTKNGLPLVSAVVLVSATLTAYISRGRQTKAITKAMEDATHEREQALLASQSKTRFLANMSHEVRTPLNGVLGMAQVLQTTINDPTKREKVDTIIDCGESLLRLLNDVLDHAKAEAGALTFEPRPEDVRAVIRQTTELYRPTAQSKGLALHFDDREVDHPYVELDAVRLRQCIGNIVSNAIKFTDNGAVLVRMKSDIDPDQPNVATFKIEVSDTGIGMTEQQGERIFNAFEQADNSISRRFGGTGLGLAVTKDIIEAMGGTISVRSMLGVGTTFQINLFWPVCAKAALVSGAPSIPDLKASTNSNSAEDPQTDQVADEEGAQRQIRVLVAEDNQVNYQVVAALLKPLNVELRWVENGLDAIDALRKEPFDVVLMDVNMPEMDGLTATREIRRSSEPYARVPIITLTAAAGQDDNDRSIEAGANAFLTKPVRADTLKAAILNWTALGAEQSAPVAGETSTNPENVKPEAPRGDSPQSGTATNLDTGTEGNQDRISRSTGAEPIEIQDPIQRVRGGGA
ncbi:MAG: response regulator [Pseudomonadota bacterium]